MTQEQEDAAKWSAIEQYKALRGRRAVLAVQSRNWGLAIVKIGEKLIANGESIIHLDLSEFPERSAMLDAQRELSNLFPLLKSLKEDLAAMGIDATALR